MEPRGSGASQVGQRPWSSSLEILCWFCLLPFCWWVREKQMLHNFFFFLPIPTGTIPVQGLYCTGFIRLRQLCEWQRDAEVRGQTDKSVDMRMQVLTAHSLTHSLPGWHW